MKKITAIIITVLLIGGLTGCGMAKKEQGKDTEGAQPVQEDTGANEDMEAKEPEADTDSAEGQAEDSSRAGISNKPLDLTEGDPILVDIYYPNEQADGFEVAQEEIYTLDIGQIMIHLAKHGVIPDGMTFLSFQTEEVDGEPAYILNMPQAFETYLSEMGTAGEYTVLGSIVNTILTAFEGNKLKVTVEDGELMTGHAEYPGYLGFFGQQ